jgi:hypothetical protein
MEIVLSIGFVHFRLKPKENECDGAQNCKPMQQAAATLLHSKPMRDSTLCHRLATFTK